jgi:hypothetical protein
MAPEKPTSSAVQNIVPSSNPDHSRKFVNTFVFGLFYAYLVVATVKFLQKLS